MGVEWGGMVVGATVGVVVGRDGRGGGGGGGRHAEQVRGIGCRVEDAEGAGIAEEHDDEEHRPLCDVGHHREEDLRQESSQVSELS